MKLTKTLIKEIKEHGFADGTKYVSEDKTPIDHYDLAEFHDSRLWSFAAGDELVRLVVDFGQKKPPRSLQVC